MFLKTTKGIILSILAAAVVLGAVYFIFIKQPESPYEFIIAEKGDVVQEVSVNGTVKPAESVDLAFERAGRIVWIGKDVGAEVFSGEALANLYNGDLTAQLAEAEASVRAQEAKLEELKRGSRPEEIRVQEVKVENARASLEESKKNLVDKIEDAYTKSDDAVRNRVDQFFTNPRASNPQLNFTLSNSQLENDVEWGRFVIESALSQWKISLDGLAISSDLDFYSSEAKQKLSQVKSFLDKVSLAVNSLSATASLTQTTIDGWKSAVSTARTNVNTATANITSAEDSLKSAQSSLLLEENELALKLAGSTPEEIKEQEAQVESAKASALNLRALIAKTILRSPISGILTKRDVEVGEIVSAGERAVSIISANKFEIEANVPEADIAKIKINNQAKITLDAYGSNVEFLAKVSFIDPAETVVEGVPTYKIKLQLEEEDSRIKPGMTANIDISTGRRDNVITVPQRAVIEKNGDKLVRILKDDGTVEEAVVKTGLRGSFGDIEITEGVSEGDRVIIFVKE